MANNGHERRLVNILRKIQRTPGIDGTRLVKETQTVKAADRLPALDQLERDGKIRVETVPTKGRPLKRYWPLVTESRVTQPEARQSVRPPRWAGTYTIPQSELVERYRGYSTAMANDGKPVADFEDWKSWFIIDTSR